MFSVEGFLPLSRLSSFALFLRVSDIARHRRVRSPPRVNISRGEGVRAMNVIRKR